MGRKKETRTINVMFCDRCGGMYGRIQVSDTLLMPMCPICHMEIFRYFVDEDMKFVHFGNVELFAEIAEKLEAHTDKLGFHVESAFYKPSGTLTYHMFVDLIRDRTKKMVLIEKRFEPQTEIKVKTEHVEDVKGDVNV